MGLFNRKQTPAVDDTLPDGQWLSHSKQAYDRAVARYYGTPETMAKGGNEAEARDDVGVALFFYCKSIDMLHTAYGFNGMQSRRPSGNDAPIVAAFCGVVERTVHAHPDAPIEEPVREVTHRLRSISTTCDAQGFDSTLYRSGLERLAAAAPHVPIDDVLWA